MNSHEPKTTTTTPSNNLAAQLQQIGLCALPAQLNDFIALATKARWCAHRLLEQLVKAETGERSRRSLVRRERIGGIKRFKPMADFDWPRFGFRDPCTGASASPGAPGQSPLTPS